MAEGDGAVDQAKHFMVDSGEVAKFGDSGWERIEGLGRDIQVADLDCDQGMKVGVVEDVGQDPEAKAPGISVGAGF